MLDCSASYFSCMYSSTLYHVFRREEKCINTAFRDLFKDLFLKLNSNQIHFN